MPQETKEKSYSLHSMRRSMVFVGGICVAYFFYLLFSGNLASFAASLAKADLRWVSGALLCYVVYYALGVFAYWLPCRGNDTYRCVRLIDLMSVEATGIFFSNLSPNGTGSPPAQIWRLTRCGLSLGQATALQYTRFIIYETAEGVFALLMLIPRYEFFMQTYNAGIWVGLILFGSKVIEVSALLAVCLFPSFSIRLLQGLAHFLEGYRRLARFAPGLRSLTYQVRDFSQGFKDGISQWRMSLLTMVVTLVQLGCLYALPWFVLNAFGIHGIDIVTCMACGSMLELLTSAIPLPGGTGGAEGGFAYLFGWMFGDMLPAGYVVWRAVEYVLPVIAAAPLSQLGLGSAGRGRGGAAVGIGR